MPKKSSKERTVAFSTTIAADTKLLLERYCQRRGIKINHFVETAIVEKLEDEMDSDLVRQRALEQTVPWRRKA